MIALFAMTDGHWLTLQSFAWANMLIEFSRSNTLAAAVEKTFDGQHPCPMCLQVRKGWSDQQQEDQKVPVLNLELASKLIWQLRRLTVPPVPLFAIDCVPLVPALHGEHIDSPPTPPPRLPAAVL
ncbi:MAG: hypothetical protein AB9869_34395 [Verrucomicrobiia bacterium]